MPALGLAVGLAPTEARDAAAQDWPPFVMVAGLLLVGLVAGRDGLFDAAGAATARLARGGPTLLVGASVLLAVVTAVLNLDTAVVFCTPVVLLAARQRGVNERPFLYLCVFMVNAASLLLPGSNLTNLIVLDGSGISARSFAAHMLPVWVVAVAAVAAVVGLRFARELRRPARPPGHGGAPSHPLLGAGLVGVGAAVVAMLALPAAAAALVVAGVGVLVTVTAAARHRVGRADVARTVNLPILVGLLGLAVALGTLGRTWDGPATLLAHLSSVGTAVVAAGASVVVNNLPAASLLAARPVPDPYALLVGLNLGPNMAVTGALSAVLWVQVATGLGARPSVRAFTRLGSVVTVVSMAAALGVLALGG